MPTIIAPVQAAASAPPVFQPSLYLTIGDFFQRYDQRLMSQLSNDNNSRVAVEATIQQNILDAESELESHLNGRYSLPIANVPYWFKRWVAAKVADAMFGRRNDRPRQLDAEIEWCDKQIKLLDDGVIGITGATHAYFPQVASSGVSEFNAVLPPLVWTDDQGQPVNPPNQT